MITVSPHALGCAPFGNLYRAVDDETVRETVSVAWDNGVRYFDTAPHYGSGLSEERLGATVRGRSSCSRPRSAGSWCLIRHRVPAGSAAAGLLAAVLALATPTWTSLVDNPPAGLPG